MGKCIILMGFMGCGKTSTGKALSEMRNLPVLDTDQMIEERAGKSISRIFEEEGEKAFRDRETALLKELNECPPDCILAIGGGMPVREENRALLRSLGEIIYLTASDEELLRRLEGDTSRPLLAGGDLRNRIRTLKEAREEIYRDLADRIIGTDGLSPREAAAKI